MFKKILLSMALTLITATAALATNYIEPQELKELMDKKKPVILVDIQTPADFEKHHLAGSIETNAFPAAKVPDKAKIDKALPVINASKDPVIVVCPFGKGGAKNTYNYLQSKGVPEDRLQILEGGIHDWPYKEMFVKGR